MDDLVRRWRKWRDDANAALEQMKNGKLGSGTNNVDDTAQSIALLESKISELDSFIEQYGASTLQPNDR
jgi:hypothetical protein